jgi:2-amino-4-hydroxy-6-hydroxymethyldihydropteridine diphosphokinase
MPSRVGLLGLGSNIGERREHLQAAVDALPGAGVEVLASSSVYDTDPVGEVPDQPSFLNACLRVRTALEPLQLLDAAKALEGELGRAARGPRHGPRAIDIDILLLGTVELRHERMCLPHEQLHNRRFVLIPALELDFELRTPGGERLADALAALPAERGADSGDTRYARLPESASVKGACQPASVGEGVRWAGPPLALAQQSLQRPRSRAGPFGAA